MDIVFGIGKIPLFKIIRSILDTVQNMLFPLCLSGEACGLVVQSAQLAVGVSCRRTGSLFGTETGICDPVVPVRWGKYKNIVPVPDQGFRWCLGCSY